MGSTGVTSESSDESAGGVAISGTGSTGVSSASSDVSSGMSGIRGATGPSSEGTIGSSGISSGIRAPSVPALQLILSSHLSWASWQKSPHSIRF